MRFMKKGQSAIEYLMNYAWAIALIIIVGVAIFALDVGGLRSSVVGQGSRATAGANEVQIVDYTYDSNDNLTLVLQNNGANLINVTNVSTITVDGTASVTSNTTAQLVSSGNTETFTIDTTGQSDVSTGNPFEVLVEITYTDKSTDLDKKIRHTISGTVQA